ncbi:hypothetical protein T05_9682 [Trichinella murrelli]|uniref:Uncharacterized protein n=2 Tax=Trichinella murrelli TaxID=144512 RepID=A0A0V0T1A9_9BILA|nr:hypothetical protein T05_9682 [Trichinella murrelli]
MTARAEFQISPSIAYCVRQVNNDVSNGKLNASVKNVDLNVEVFSISEIYSICSAKNLQKFDVLSNNVSSCSAFGLSYSLEDSNNA